jgi:hypothetical protein
MINFIGMLFISSEYRGYYAEYQEMWEKRKTDWGDKLRIVTIFNEDLDKETLYGYLEENENWLEI